MSYVPRITARQQQIWDLSLSLHLPDAKVYLLTAYSSNLPTPPPSSVTVCILYISFDTMILNLSFKAFLLNAKFKVFHYFIHFSLA